jgi:hypothetical protein
MASEIARMELAPHGVRVVTVYPGPVRSDPDRRARAQASPGLLTRLIPTGQPEPLARRVLDAIERDEARVFYPRAVRRRGARSRARGALHASVEPGAARLTSTMLGGGGQSCEHGPCDSGSSGSSRVSLGWPAGAGHRSPPSRPRTRRTSDALPPRSAWTRWSSTRTAEQARSSRSGAASARSTSAAATTAVRAAFRFDSGPVRRGERSSGGPRSDAARHARRGTSAVLAGDASRSATRCAKRGTSAARTAPASPVPRGSTNGDGPARG